MPILSTAKDGSLADLFGRLVLDEIEQVQDAGQGLAVAAIDAHSFFEC